MKSLLCFTLIVCGILPWVLCAGESAPSGQTPLKRTSSLKFQNGKYSSIFGIVPKEYRLESQETREILQRRESDSVFTLELVASETRRILTLEGEPPTLESAPKPLTGRTIRATKQGESWKAEIVGVEKPTEEETREAMRLVTRFAPGSSPFSDLTWSSEGVASLDLIKVLSFLGYSNVQEAHGSAEAKRPSLDDAKSTAADVVVEIKASFVSGDGPSRLTVDLHSKGPLVVEPADSERQTLTLEGKLALHGQRGLPDGRIVPYNLITDFVYTTTALNHSPSGG